MFFADALTIDAPKPLKDGYVAVRARAAKTGVYQYTGREVDPTNAHGLRDKPIVNVLRDENTVFDAAAVRSFIGKPITNDHPTVAVNASNWRDHARGTIMGAMRDGEYLAFDLMLTDKAAIDAINGGKRELSNGYSAELQFGDFKAPDGTVCEARQSKITDGNHVALVDQGRAGPECRIADKAPWAICDAIPAPITTKEDRVKVINLDGLPVNLTDAAATEAAITTLDGKVTAAITARDAATADLATANGKIAALEQQLADAQAAADPAALDKRVADRAALIAQAKAVKADIVTDGKTDAEIRRAVVEAKLGDKCPTEDAAIAGAFAVLADAKPASTEVSNLNPSPKTFADTASVRDLVRASRY